MSTVSTILGLGRSAASYGASAARKVVPARKKIVKENLLESIAELVSNIRQHGGVSANVSGSRGGGAQILPVGSPGFGGTMMARRPEVAGSRVPMSAVDEAVGIVRPKTKRGKPIKDESGEELVIMGRRDDTALRQALDDLAESDPGFIRDLSRGKSVGGWIEDGNVVFDTPTRFMTQRNATIAGLRANQQAGFNLSTGETDFLRAADGTGWLLSRALGRQMGRTGSAQAAAGAASAGLGAADAADGDTTPLGFLALGVGAALGLRGAFNITRGAGLIRSVGSRVQGSNMTAREALGHMRLSPNELSDRAYESALRRRTRRLNLEESDELRAMANKYPDLKKKSKLSDADLAVAALRETGVSNKTVEAAVRSAKTSRERWEVAYNVSLAHNAKIMGRSSGAEFKKIKSELVDKIRLNDPGFDPDSKGFVSGLASELREMFATPAGLPNVSSAQVSRLDGIAARTRSGAHRTLTGGYADPNLGLRNVRFAEDADDVTQLISLGRFDEAAAALADIEWNMSKVLLDAGDIAARGEAAKFYVLSMMRNRVQEAATRAPGPSVALQNAVASARSSPVDEIAKSSVADVRAARNMPLRPVDLGILEAGEIASRNPAGALVSEPIPGIGFKTSPYAQSQQGPEGIRGMVHDSWMHRAVTGASTKSSGESVSNPELAHTYALLNYVGDRVAKRKGLTSLPTLQEEAWYPARILDSRSTQPSFVSTEGPRNLRQITQRPTIAEIRGVSESSLPKSDTEEYAQVLNEIFDIGPLDSIFDIVSTPGVRARGERLTAQQLNALEELLSNPDTREEALRRIAMRPGGQGLTTRQTPETFRPARVDDVGPETVAEQRGFFRRRMT